MYLENVLSVYKVVIDHIWSQSEKLVPANEPGNFNQAMMDLGATVCTPKKPSCRTCPVSHLCLAYQRVQHTNPLRELQTEATKPVVEDIENGNGVFFLHSYQNILNFLLYLQSQI